jgi:hypothetical protein
VSATATSTVTPLAGAVRAFSATTTLDAVRAAIANPGANPTLTILIVSAAALVVLLFAVFVVMLVTPSRKRVVKVRRYYGAPPSEEALAAQAAAEAEARERARREALERARRMRRQTNALLAAAALIAVVGTYAASSTDRYCADTCHAGSDAVEAAAAAEHAPCVTCHEAGLLDMPANTASRTRMIVGAVRGVKPGSASVAVRSDACLRCHRDVRSGSVVSKTTGVTMSHAEVLAGGVPCSECHARTGHDADAFTATMSACLPCHDAKTASAECETCHTTDPSVVPVRRAETTEGADVRGSGKYKYPAVRAAKRECGGCHDEEKTCDPCHGIRMPHTKGFKEGGHARNAAFEGKRVCWRCHDPQWCGSPACHRAAFDPVTGATAHGANWKAEHKRSDWAGGCVCHSQRGGSRGNESMCTLCHGPDRRLLPPAR